MEEKVSLKNLFSKLSDFKSIKWIIRQAKPQTFNIVLLTILNVFLAVIAVMNSYMLRYVINSATGVFGDSTPERIQGIAMWGSVFAALIVTNFVMTICSNRLVFVIESRLIIHIRTALYRQMIQKRYDGITKFHTGEMLNRLNNDVGTVTSAITSLIPGVVYLFAKLIGIFVVLFDIDPLFTLTFVGVGLFVFVISSLFRRVLKSYHKQIAETEGKIRSFMQETLSSLLVVKIFRAENKVTDSAKELQEVNYKRKSKRNMFSLTTSGIFQLTFNAAYLFGLFYCGVKIAHHDSVITYGVLSQVLSLVSQIRVPINSLTAILPQYYSAVASAERIIEIYELEDEPMINSGDLDCIKFYDNLQSVRFDNISFSYDRELIFENTDLTINKGDLVVMTGISGIGKSTLTKLLLGVFPLDSGEIYFSMNDGSKVVADCNMRPLFSYVPQGNFLLSGTLRDNISFIKSDATDDEIYQAVHLACADFIKDLPEGLDTVIGEKGLGLSEGQVQRVAIARAFLSDAPIIILDEATSALDEATELELLKNVKNLANKTCILISHKKAANAVCNKEVRIVDRKIRVFENEKDSKS